MPAHPEGTKVRPAAVAGQFYPGAAHRLRAEVAALLAQVPASADTSPKALIAPHAGYVYSGKVAATAFAAVRGSARTISARRPDRAGALRSIRRDRHSDARCVRDSAGTRAAGSRCPGDDRRSAVGHRGGRAAPTRARTRGRAAVPADPRARLHAGAVADRRRQPGTRVRRPSPPLGRSGNAAGRQLRPLALSRLRRCAASRCRDRRDDRARRLGAARRRQRLRLPGGGGPADRSQSPWSRGRDGC